MNISYKATNTSLTASLRNFIEEKMEPLQKFLKEEDRIRVELEVDKRNKDGQHFRAEVDIQPHGYYAESRASDFYAAMDLVMPKIKEQLAKKKEKNIDKRRSAARKMKGK